MFAVLVKYTWNTNIFSTSVLINNVKPLAGILWHLLKPLGCSFMGCSCSWAKWPAPLILFWDLYTKGFNDCSKQMDYSDRKSSNQIHIFTYFYFVEKYLPVEPTLTLFLLPLLKAALLLSELEQAFCSWPKKIIELKSYVKMNSIPQKRLTFSL